MVKNKKRKTIAAASLICGYVFSILFILLIVLNSLDREIEAHVIRPNTIIVEHNNTTIRTVYVDRLPSNDNITPFANPVQIHTPIKTNGINNTHENTFYDRSFVNRDDNLVVVDHNIIDRENDRVRKTRDVRRVRSVVGDSNSHDRLDVVDHGLLSRRLREIDTHKSTGKSNGAHDIDYGGLSPVSDTDGDLGEIGDITRIGSSRKLERTGELYAYNYPSKGVGAGIGSSSLGASTGLAAGIGAGVGEGISNGDTVPTLGGVGTSSPGSAGTAGAEGVGGLVAGSGAGSAAGLYTGTVRLLPGIGSGGSGTGVNGYDHLPEDGALHIMMHVDGSGSILNTRKQLDIMKNTMLKTALLPYYNNDENLYNRRVTIVDGSGERTLRFFTEATKKDNVLAVVFQDEAQPAYHLPNFNKRPESHYSDDLSELKQQLNNYNGLYRGIMFQVGDKVFSRSFKEFVQNAWKGEGYLANDNLKKYYWRDNSDQIDNNHGVVFSDEYHASPTGDPQYYLDLIFSAAAKVGINLNVRAGGLTDGTYTSD